MTSLNPPAERTIEDCKTDYPVCPVCKTKVQRSGKWRGKQQYRCVRCGVYGIADTISNNALRKAGLLATCNVCGKRPAKYGALCAGCNATQQRAKLLSKKIPDETKTVYGTWVIEQLFISRKRMRLRPVRGNLAAIDMLRDAEYTEEETE